MAKAPQALHESDAEMADASSLVRQLSKPLRRAILALDGERFADWNRVLRQRRQRIRLVELGLIEPDRQGPVTLWFNIRLTALGREVQGLLADQAPTRHPTGT